MDWFNLMEHTNLDKSVVNMNFWELMSSNKLIFGLFKPYVANTL